MIKINEIQYYWALNRVEELLPLVTDSTPVTAPESIELEILSNLVADYSEEHFSICKDSKIEEEKDYYSIQHDDTRSSLR